jgi:hypothetical protein
MRLVQDVQEGQMRAHRGWHPLQTGQVRLGAEWNALYRGYLPRWALRALPDATALPHPA